MAAEKTSVVSAAKTSVVSAAKKAETAVTSAATSDISIPSTPPWRGRRRRPRQGVVDSIEMSDVAADVAAVAAFLAADTTDVWAAGRARPKAERRRPKANLMRPKADVVKARPSMIDEWPDLPGHRLAKMNGLACLATGWAKYASSKMS